MSYNIPEHIENPSAYAAAIDRNIKANAWKTKRAAFERDEPELYAALRDLWTPRFHPCCEARELDGYGDCTSCGAQGGGPGWQRDGSHLDLQTMTAKERDAILRKLSWLGDGYDKYGSLTPNQAAKAKEIIEETKAKISKWEDEDELRKLNATPWENGRQEFPCTVVSLKLKDVPKFSYYDSGVAWKMIVQREDGSRLYCTAPSKLLDAAFARADTEWGEDKIERAARGMKLVLRVNVERANDDPIFGFGKRPHIVEVLDA